MHDSLMAIHIIFCLQWLSLASFPGPAQLPSLAVWKAFNFSFAHGESLGTRLGFHMFKQKFEPFN